MMISIAIKILVMAKESSKGTGIAIPDIALVTETAGATANSVCQDFKKNQQI